MTGEAGETSISILGVILVKNEERFIAWSLMSIVAFCDRILVLDNQSTDRTRTIVDAIAARHPHIEVTTVEDAYDTHRFVEGYAGSNTWVLGADGDEIYDTAGLARLRTRLLAGAYDDYWRLSGHCLHVLGADLDRGEAFGFAPPAAPALGKLFNFAAIESWRQGRHQRLHGKNVVFREPFDRNAVARLYQTEPWEGSDLRLLHLCFLPRSSLDDGRTTRPNPSEKLKAASLLRRARRAVVGLIDPAYDRKKNYKLSNYAKGEVVHRTISAFGVPDAFCAFDSECDAAMETIARFTEDRRSHY